MIENLALKMSTTHFTQCTDNFSSAGWH